MVAEFQIRDWGGREQFFPLGPQHVITPRAMLRRQQPNGSAKEARRSASAMTRTVPAYLETKAFGKLRSYPGKREDWLTWSFAFVAEPELPARLPKSRSKDLMPRLICGRPSTFWCRVLRAEGTLADTYALRIGGRRTYGRHRSQLLECLQGIQVARRTASSTMGPTLRS